jgi:hypothetical protein
MSEQSVVDCVLEQRPDDIGPGIVKLDAEDHFGSQRGTQLTQGVPARKTCQASTKRPTLSNGAPATVWATMGAHRS